MTGATGKKTWLDLIKPGKSIYDIVSYKQSSGGVRADDRRNDPMSKISSGTRPRK